MKNHEMNFSRDKWYKQKSPSDHLPAVVFNLFHLLNIPATISKIRETLKRHPDFPSLLSMGVSLPVPFPDPVPNSAPLMTAYRHPKMRKKSSGIPLEGQALPAPYPSHAPGRNGVGNWHRLFPIWVFSS